VYDFIQSFAAQDVNPFGRFADVVEVVIGLWTSATPLAVRANSWSAEPDRWPVQGEPAEIGGARDRRLEGWAWA